MSKTLQRFNTPCGEARWCYVQEPKAPFDRKGDPKYEVTIIFDPKDAIWVNWCKTICASVKASNGKHNPIKWETEKDKQGVKVKTGKLAVRFRTGAQYKPGLFDKFGRKMPDGTLIGNGSKIVVNYSPDTYTGFDGGVTLYLNAIQVMELIPYVVVGKAEDYGFQTETPPPDETSFDAAIGVPPDDSGTPIDDLPF